MKNMLTGMFLILTALAIIIALGALVVATLGAKALAVLPLAILVLVGFFMLSPIVGEAFYTWKNDR